MKEITKAKKKTILLSFKAYIEIYRGNKSNPCGESCGFSLSDEK